MKTIWTKIKTFQFPETLTPVVILGVCAAAYGLMIPYIGFYWDDWPFTWIYDTFGPAGLTMYFETKRSVAGLDLPDDHAAGGECALEVASLRPGLALDQRHRSMGAAARRCGQNAARWPCGRPCCLPFTPVLIRPISPSPMPITSSPRAFSSSRYC